MSCYCLLLMFLAIHSMSKGTKCAIHPTICKVVRAFNPLRSKCLDCVPKVSQSSYAFNGGNYFGWMSSKTFLSIPWTAHHARYLLVQLAMCVQLPRHSHPWTEALHLEVKELFLSCPWTNGHFPSMPLCCLYNKPQMTTLILLPYLWRINSCL